MVIVKLTNSDKRELQKTFPSLNCETRKKRVWGTVEFHDCVYFPRERKVRLDVKNDESISDSYEIEINFNKPDIFNFPSVYETGKKIPREDEFHTSIDGKLCLGVFPQYEWVSTSKYIQDKILHILFWQSYKRIHGKEPWKGYSHGKAGLEEAKKYHEENIEHLQKQKTQIKYAKRKNQCPCGSGKQYRWCCSHRVDELEREINKVRNAVRKIQKAIEFCDQTKKER